MKSICLVINPVTLLWCTVQFLVIKVDQGNCFVNSENWFSLETLLWPWPVQEIAESLQHEFHQGRFYALGFIYGKAKFCCCNLKLHSHFYPPRWLSRFNVTPQDCTSSQRGGRHARRQATKLRLGAGLAPACRGELCHHGGKGYDQASL